MIEAQNISKSFNEKKVLDNVSCTFEPGKVNLIIGGSGSGKTVLMKCLVGLYEVDEGKVVYDNRNFSALSHKERKPIQQEIGMVFQGGALFDSLNVEKNVMFPLTMFSQMTFVERRERANTCLNRVNLVNVGHLFPSEISGGMKKRVAIARAIVNNPRYLFCDEPNSGLDPKTSLVIDKLIQEITEEYKTTTIINTHDMNSVTEIGEKIIFIYKGKKWWEGNAEELMKNDNTELNEFVFASKMMQSLKRV
ncbi:MAG TPA: ATP-binding cassette domain-containing protein [Bacteroidia bacterium]|nr:ATP-binding cassette domain-containing protein [Bacteroidia bacterium]